MAWNPHSDHIKPILPPPSLRQFLRYWVLPSTTSCHFASRGLPSENGFPRSLVSELLLTLACLLMNTKTNQGVAMKHRWNQEAMRMPPAEYFCLSASSISATYFSGAVLQGSPIS